MRVSSLIIVSCVGALVACQPAEPITKTSQAVYVVSMAPIVVPPPSRRPVPSWILATADMTVSQTPSNVPTATALVSATSEPSQTPTLTPGISTPTATPVGTTTPTPAPTAMPVGTTTPAPTATPVGTTTPTPAPTATPVHTPTPTRVRTPSPTATANPPPDAPVQRPPGRYVQLSWTPPDQREDGTRLDESEISAFQIRYSASNSPVITTLVPGWYTSTQIWVTEAQRFEIATIDTDGLRSDFVVAQTPVPH